jgi:DNA-binding response OmpR family regulator
MARIVVCDDSRAICELVALALNHDGHDTRIARDGHAALDLLGSEPVDLLISDIMMPRMGGRELALRLRGDGSDVAVPIHFISAASGSQALGSAFQPRHDGFLAKPFRVAALRATVETLLRRAELITVAA